MHFDNPESNYYSLDDPSTARIMEKDYYSNFVCCGIRLGDLHELVNHCEEHHAQATLSSFPESLPLSPPSPIIESPVSACPVTPSPPNLFPTLTASFTPAIAFSSTVQPDFPMYSEHGYSKGATSRDRSYPECILHDQNKNQAHHSAWSSGVSGACSTVSSTAGNHVYSLQPSSIQQSIKTDLEMGRVPLDSVSPKPVLKENPIQNQNDSSKSHDFPPTIAPTPIYALHPSLSIITDLTRDLLSSPDERGRSTSDVPALGDGKEINQSQSNGRRKKVLHSNNLKPTREKTYKCPHAGCVKSYLNLNGLKYHLTKGVCTLSS